MSSELGVKLHFGAEVTTLGQMGEADLIVGANGAFSWIRSENEDRFGTATDWGHNKFIWYGSTKAFDSLTLTFRETDLGVFCAHHYRYQPDRSTFLVEVAPELELEVLAPSNAATIGENVAVVPKPGTLAPWLFAPDGPA
jgi:hypothetical protein